MNPLRKAVRDYLRCVVAWDSSWFGMRPGCGSSCLSWHENAVRTSPLTWHWSGQRNMPITSPLSGRRDSASCVASPVTGVRRIPRQKFHRSGCCPTGPHALNHTSIPITKSGNC